MSNKNKPPSCNKVKNPCKFCLQQVDKKTGLQCQGACKKWAHFKCLNYTPGKISDIKAGIIKVTCPCPDCETTEPKEFLTNPPFTCSNQQCPANKNPKCESFTCPSNKRRQQAPVPDYRPSNTPSIEFADQACSNEAIPCPAVECPNSQKRSHPRMSPPRPPTPPRSAQKKSPPGSPQCRGTPQACRTKGKEAKRSNPKSSPACPNKCDSPKKKKASCPTKSPSCSLLSSENSAHNKQCFSSSSESHMGSPGKKASMVQALQEMCGTVGKLSVQLKELMCKMMQNV